MKNDYLKIEDIFIELEDEQLMPYKGSNLAAAFDLRAAQDYSLAPGETALISTGVKLALPAGYEAQIRPRSGLSLKSRLRVVNSPGTIDADFRDEIKIILHNDFSQAEIPQIIASQNPLLERYGKIVNVMSLADYANAKQIVLPHVAGLGESQVYLNADGKLWGSEDILKYERVAQILIKPICIHDWQQVEDVKLIGEDRGGGFGHSGRV